MCIIKVTWDKVISLEIFEKYLILLIHFTSIFCMFSVCFLCVFCVFSVCFLSGELAQIKTFIWFLLNEDWHFSLWNLNWNLNWKRRKIIFHFLIWPQINLSFCSDIRTSYLLKRKLGINTQHKRCYTFQRSLTKNKFTKVKVFPLSNIVI